jgi:hypothetical protein
MPYGSANKKMTMMTPIIDLKRWFSLFKHHFTLFLNILLVDCYVGKLLGRLHMVCIWRRPMSNLKVFIFQHHVNGSFSWTSFNSKTRHPASRAQFFSRQLTSVTWKISFLQHFLHVRYWYWFGERCLSPNQYQYLTCRIQHKVPRGSLSSPWQLPPRL